MRWSRIIPVARPRSRSLSALTICRCSIWCGVVGFRPSPGVVPSVRKLLGWTPLSVVGPMGRTVEDACLQLAASAGMHAGDPLSYPLDPLSFLTPPAVDMGRKRPGNTPLTPVA
jgi:Asp-tRNA(Asn)/Glu-tRNA(Gln) amidotransferase A subunit family amidase